MPEAGEFRVRDARSGQWLVLASVTGTTWCGDREGARVYPTRELAEAAARKSRWLDYEPEVVPA